MSEISAQISSSTRGLTREFELIAHNMANVSTPGFKRRYNDFSQLMAEQGLGSDTAGGDENSQLLIDFSQGNLIETGRTLDTALYGNGFFVIETPQGPLYTRNGTFQLNESGQIVDLAGRIVAGESGPITVPSTLGPSELFISQDGTLTGAGTAIGKLKLVDFKDHQNVLVPAGLNCFSAPEGLEPEPAEAAIIKQGYREGSNVQITEELVDMITVSRLYDANMKILAKSGESTKSLIDVAMS